MVKEGLWGTGFYFSIYKTGSPYYCSSGELKNMTTWRPAEGVRDWAKHTKIVPKELVQWEE